MITAVVYVIAFIVSYFVLKWFRKSRKQHGSANPPQHTPPPCLPYLPIVGSLPFIPDPRKFFIHMMKESKKLGNVIAFYMGSQYIVVLNGRETIERALIGKSLNFASRPSNFICKLYNPNFKGIIEHPFNEEFRKYHKMCLNVLKKFGLGQTQMEARITAELEHFLQQMKLKEGKSFNPEREFQLTFFNVISSILFGRRWSSEDSEFHNVMEVGDVLVRSYILTFFPFLRFFPYFRGQLKLLVNSLRTFNKFLERNVRSATDEETFYRQLIEEEQKTSDESDSIDEEQLRMIVRDMTFGGTETLSTTIRWLLVYMANHQNVQEKMKDEIHRVVGVERFPSYDDKPKMPITEACIWEVMRIRTLAPTSLPHLTLSDCVIDGKYIPGGTTVLPNLYSAHMDAEAWHEPEKFKVERFLNDDHTEVINRNLVIPFSLGKRSCLGEPLARVELFLFVSTLIQHFQVLPPEGEKEVEVEEVFGTTVTPSPHKIRLVERAEVKLSLDE